MNYSDRGPGLFGLIRWECYCLGLDPEAITEDRIRKLLLHIGYDHSTTKDANLIVAQKAARAEWNSQNAPKLAPMAIHWNAKLPIVPTIGKD